MKLALGHRNLCWNKNTLYASSILIQVTSSYIWGKGTESPFKLSTDRFYSSSNLETDKILGVHSRVKAPFEETFDS